MPFVHKRGPYRRLVPVILIFAVGFYVRDSLSSLVDGQIGLYPIRLWGEIWSSCHTNNQNSGLDQTAKNHDRAAGSHRYHQDGLLEVNPDGPHPIHELIKNGEEEWERKLNSASRTLEEAVVEYKRRYKRAPPQGFDDW